MNRCATLLVLTVALAACGGTGDRGTTSNAASPSPSTASAQPTATATCPGAGRHDVAGGLLRVPAGARAGATPLIVVVIPGGRGDPGDALGIARAATRRGFAVLYPTRPGDHFWTLNRAQGSADVDTVKGLLDRVVAGGCVDARRISITGVSNGAGFAARMACEDPERFAAVVPVAAGYRALDRCPATARTSFLAIHGTADTIVPYRGKAPGFKGNVPRYAAGWARRDGCASAPRTTSPRPRVTRISWTGCQGALRVGIVRLAGTTHGWPGARDPRFPMRNPSRFSATRELLRFVAGARRPA